MQPKMLQVNGVGATASMWYSLLQVVIGATIVALPVILSDLFNDVSTDLDLSHYAERAGWAGAYLPAWLPMPANTFVNIGYLVVGLFWITRVHLLNQQHKPRYKVNPPTADICYNFYVFAWMSVIYGPVQCYRILTRSHSSAVLDQWYTLPIFAWVIVWSIDICWPISGSTRQWTVRTLAIMFTSVLSYLLALFYVIGFEIALAVHIPAVVALSWRVHSISETGTRQERFNAYVKALLCCAGFVVLKLADHWLAAQLPSLFTILSGHFWSKIADFMQIHYVCMFFWYAQHGGQVLQANGKHC